jgi:hypothetical protein
MIITGWIFPERASDAMSNEQSILNHKLRGNAHYFESDALKATEVQRFVHPVVDVSPILVADRPKFFGDNNFWQYPCATERQAFLNHKTINLGENINEHAKEAHTYLGLPWATYIDRQMQYPDELDLVVARLAALRSQIVGLGYKLRIHTVCQHIVWQRAINWFEKLGVTDLHLSHCESRFREDFNQEPLSIHSWPLIAASVEGTDVSAEVRIRSVDDRKYIVSFVGAHMPHYRSDIRLRLQKELGKSRKPDVLFVLRKEWHFNQIVYEEQVAGRSLGRFALWRQRNGMIRYNQVLANSIFSLCPEGAGPNTLRIWESLALGSIPVIIADGWVPPLAHGCDVQLVDCCLFVSSTEIVGILQRLRTIGRDQQRWMQNAGRRLYETFKGYRCGVS